MLLLNELHRQGNTIIIVTHERDIARHAQRVLSILDGQIAEDSLVDESERNGVH